MIKTITKQVFKRIKWARENMILDSISSLDEFQDFIKRTKSGVFLFYQNLSPAKCLDFQTAVDKMQLPVKDKNVLDIGPGYGNMLDISHELGAKSIHFVEWEPVFFAYNRLKDFAKGYRINFMRKLHVLESAKYDLIWAKSAIQTDTWLKYPWLVDIKDWVAQIERIAAPDGKIVICPHYHSDASGKRFIDIYHNKLTDAMLKQGFTILPWIENHNFEPHVPITFFKVAGSQAKA